MEQPSDITKSRWIWVVGAVVGVALVATYALTGYRCDPAGVTERWHTILTIVHLR